MSSLQKLVKVFCFILLISIIACKDKLIKPNPALATIDLQRGDILLCGTPQFGAVSFALDCQYDVRKTFDLAISPPHSFEYDEAEKAFVKVIDADLECAMAYWGVAISIYHKLWAFRGPKELKKGTVLLEIAESLRKSKRLERYIDTIKVFYNAWETVDHKTRELLYEKKMEQIYACQKDDTGPTIFYDLAIISLVGPTDKTYPSQKKASGVLRNLFKEKPNHPRIAHYEIHTYDYPEIVHSALNTGRRYAEIAPASAHAQHMPSHIFTRLGLWQESIHTNINSAAAAAAAAAVVCYTESAEPDANWAQEIHVMDYLVYAYLQQGNNKEVAAQNEYLSSMKKIFPINNFAVAYTANAIPARIALENRLWKEAARLERPNIEFNWRKFPWSKSILHFAKAMGSSRSGDIASAKNPLKIIESFHKKLLEINSAEATYKAGQVPIEIKTTEA
jgi:hypothetical protein